MKTGVAAFRFALVGFTLPYMFVFRPELLMLASDGNAAPWLDVAKAVALALLGIIPFAAGIAGHLVRPLPVWQRALLFVAAALLLIPGTPLLPPVGLALFAAVSILNYRATA
jgi:TRAP-type uncharacterized transport system fused permease subunit